jgi:hypothetical protein
MTILTAVVMAVAVVVAAGSWLRVVHALQDATSIRLQHIDDNNPKAIARVSPNEPNDELRHRGAACRDEPGHDRGCFCRPFRQKPPRS